LFLRAQGRIMTREHIIDEVWGRDVFVTDRVVDTHIVKLRRKIERDPVEPTHIVSVRGIGYRFDA
jgi:two-component system, OmpR family, response regulator RegX3